MQSYLFSEARISKLLTVPIVPPEILEISESNEGYPSIIMLTDVHFSQVMSSNSALDFTFACCPGTREPGSAPPNRRASEVRCKTPEINLWRPSLVDLFVPPRHFARGPRSHPQGVPGESPLGCTPPP